MVIYIFGAQSCGCALSGAYSSVKSCYAVAPPINET